VTGSPPVTVPPPVTAPSPVTVSPPPTVPAAQAEQPPPEAQPPAVLAAPAEPTNRPDHREPPVDGGTGPIEQPPGEQGAAAGRARQRRVASRPAGPPATTDVSQAG
jgi:ribonuclease E